MIRYRLALETCTVLNMSACKNVLAGIDCGTLNTRVAVYHDKIDSDTKTVPSDIWFSPEIHIGQSARAGRKNVISGYHQVLGRTAKDATITELMQRKDSYLVNDGDVLQYKLVLKGEERKLRPELVLALFLDKVTDDDVSDAVLTVPAHFTQSQRLGLLDAAKLSKLNVPRLLSKSTAVAIAYFVKNSPIERSKNVLIYHLDATAFEVAVVTCTSAVVDVKYCQGMNKYGGLYVNQFIYEAVKKEINDPKFVMDGNLFRKIENAKRQLLDSQEGIIELPKYDDYQYNLTRREFDALLEKEVVTPTMKHVDDALKTCSLSRADVHNVVLSGGHCNAGAIKDRLARDFPVYAGCSAAVGAAHFCANLKKRKFEIHEPVELRIRQEDSAVEVTQRNEPEAQIRIECAVDANGLCDVTVRQPTGLSEADIEELRFEKEALLRQNVELQKIKEAHSELRLAEHRFRVEIEGLNVPAKYKVMFAHLCDAAAGGGLEAYVRKRVVLENYVRYVRMFDKGEDIYDYLTTTK